MEQYDYIYNKTLAQFDDPTDKNAIMAATDAAETFTAMFGYTAAAGKIVSTAGKAMARGKTAASVAGKLGDATKEKIERVRAEAQRTNYRNNLKDYNGGSDYHNSDGKLPNGQYKEFDLDPSYKGTPRGPERIVIEKNTGKVYYTPDHYGKFIEIP